MRTTTAESAARARARRDLLLRVLTRLRDSLPGNPPSRPAGPARIAAAHRGLIAYSKQPGNDLLGVLRRSEAAAGERNSDGNQGTEREPR